MNPDFDLPELKDHLLKGRPFLDVRAPVEFAQGHLPGAVNLPILNDDERAQVGLTYKSAGREAALELGHRLVSGEIKNQRVSAWLEFFKGHPEALIYCFRGGLRSQITRTWLAEAGLKRPLLKGGYKVGRNFLLSEIERSAKQGDFYMVSGPTGSGKTKFLKDLDPCLPVLHLEEIARHRGSAFGALEDPQPSQINFENTLAVEILKAETKLGGTRKFVMEDESHLIGQRAIPKVFFERMRTAPVIWLDVPLAERVRNIQEEYVSEAVRGKTEAQVRALFEKHKNSVRAITRKLGGLRAQEILLLLDEAEKAVLSDRESSVGREWIEKLLVYYYDPIYLGSLERRKVDVIVKGPAEICSRFLKNLL